MMETRRPVLLTAIDLVDQAAHLLSLVDPKWLNEANEPLARKVLHDAIALLHATLDVRDLEAKRSAMLPAVISKPERPGEGPGAH